MLDKVVLFHIVLIGIFQERQIPLLFQWNQYFINYSVIIERKYQS